MAHNNKMLNRVCFSSFHSLIKFPPCWCNILGSCGSELCIQAVLYYKNKTAWDWLQWAKQGAGNQQLLWEANLEEINVEEMCRGTSERAMCFLSVSRLIIHHRLGGENRDNQEGGMAVYNHGLKLCMGPQWRNGDMGNKRALVAQKADVGQAGS